MSNFRHLKVLLNFVMMTNALKMYPGQYTDEQATDINTNRKLDDVEPELGPGPAPGLAPRFVPPNQIGPGYHSDLNQIQNKNRFNHNKHSLVLPLFHYIKPNQRRVGGSKPPQKRNVPLPLHKGNFRNYNPRANLPRYPPYSMRPAIRPKTRQAFTRANSRSKPVRSISTPDTSETSSVTSSVPADEGESNVKPIFEHEHHFGDFDTMSYSKLFLDSNGFDSIPEKVDAILKAQAKPYGKKPITYGHLGFTGNFFNSPKPAPKPIPRSTLPKDYGKTKYKKAEPVNSGRQRVDFTPQYDVYKDEYYQSEGQMSERASVDENVDAAGYQWRKKEPTSYESEWQSYSDHPSAWQAKDRPRETGQSTYNNQNSYHYEVDDHNTNSKYADSPAQSTSWQSSQNYNQNYGPVNPKTKNYGVENQKYNPKTEDYSYSNQNYDQSSQVYDNNNQNYDQSHQWQIFTKKEDQSVPISKTSVSNTDRGYSQTVNHDQDNGSNQKHEQNIAKQDQNNQKQDENNQKFEQNGQRYDQRSSDMQNMQWQSFHKTEGDSAGAASTKTGEDRWTYHEEPNIWNNVHDGYKRLVSAQQSGDVGSEWNAKFAFWDTNNYASYPTLTRDPDVHNVNYVKQYFKRTNG